MKNEGGGEGRMDRYGATVGIRTARTDIIYSRQTATA